MQDQFITLSSGRKLCYVECGDPRGVPMFYFHGWPSSRLQGELMHKVGLAIAGKVRSAQPHRPYCGLFMKARRPRLGPGARLVFSRKC